MKVAVAIVQVILGLIFLVLGLNGFLNFLHAPLPGGMAGEFLGVLMGSHYVWLVAGTQVVSGALLLINRFVPLALVLAGALLANILTYHATMDDANAGLAIGVTILWLFLVWRYRASFAQLLAPKTARETI